MRGSVFAIGGLALNGCAHRAPDAAVEQQTCDASFHEIAPHRPPSELVASLTMDERALRGVCKLLC